VSIFVCDGCTDRKLVVSNLRYSFVCLLFVVLVSGRLCGRWEGCTGFWWGNLRERDHWGDVDAHGRIILRWIFRKWEGVV